ncbi:MAG: pyridoxal phosphate-dependent aminotransferase, partial [Bacteroidia bacterium]|nr:pyridoxal phosphate-dependent aminotransferase [Bacteroidia bacterium]
YNFEEVVERKNTYSIKYDNVEEIFKEKDLIPLWVADMDFKVPDVIQNELQNVLDQGIYAYSLTPDSYYNAFTNWCSKRYQWKIQKSDLADFHGLIPALNVIIKTLTSKGDSIIIQPPVYRPFTSAIENNGRVVVENRLKYNQGKYTIDFDLFEEQAKMASMFILCSPHNPVGRVWTKAELEQLASICLKNKVIIVSDDIHCDIIFSGNKHIPIASLSEDISNQCITLMAPGKTFNLQGLQSAFAITTNTEYLDKIIGEREVQGFMLNNLFSMVSCKAAYGKGEDWLNALLPYIEANRNFVIDFFKSNLPVIKPVHSEGTYIMWLDCTATGKSHEELKDIFLHKAKVAVVDGKFFDKQADGFCRLNIGTPRSILTQALERIQAAFS